MDEGRPGKNPAINACFSQAVAGSSPDSPRIPHKEITEPFPGDTCPCMKRPNPENFYTSPSESELTATSRKQGLPGARKCFAVFVLLTQRRESKVRECKAGTGSQAGWHGSGPS